MNEESRHLLDDYYREASSWNRDRVDSIHSSRRIAWVVASVAAALALFEAIALVLLTPLKTVEPYTLMVDRTTGYVQALKPLDQSKISPDSALTQSFLVQYVIAREGFDMATLKANYRRVALFSADNARSSYLQTMQVSNRASPLLIYPRTTSIDVRVKSVSPIGPNSAMVRFDTSRSEAGAEATPLGSWVAIVRYRYSGEPMSVEDRFVNPLGFQVVSYRKDPEALPDAASAATIPSLPSIATIQGNPTSTYPHAPPMQPTQGAGQR